jgi:hypothetical protein
MGFSAGGLFLSAHKCSPAPSDPSSLLLHISALGFSLTYPMELWNHGTEPSLSQESSLCKGLLFNVSFETCFKQIEASHKMLVERQETRKGSGDG